MGAAPAKLVRQPTPARSSCTIGRAPQAAVGLAGQVCRALPGQGLQIGRLAVDERQDQEPAAPQWVAVATTGPEYLPARRHTLRQAGQGPGPGLLAATRAVGHYQTSIPGLAWTVKGFQAFMAANLSSLSY